MNIIISTLNAKYIHTSLSIRYLKSYAEPEFPVTLAEYTIKDPIMNIVSDLYAKKPDVIGFSCYIWNIEETIKVIQFDLDAYLKSGNMIKSPSIMLAYYDPISRGSRMFSLTYSEKGSALS
jgi:hypothetical protein